MRTTPRHLVSSRLRASTAARFPAHGALALVGLALAGGTASACQTDVEQNGAADDSQHTAAGAAATRPISAARTEDDWTARDFARERHIELADAVRRLEQQSRLTGFTEALETALGAEFGGVWVDPANDDRIKVGFAARPESTSSGSSAEAKREGALSWGAQPFAANAAALIEASAADARIVDYDMVAVKHSYGELEAANEWLSERILANPAYSKVNLSAGLRPDINAVRIGLPPEHDLEPDHVRLAEEAQARFGDMIKVEQNQGRPVLDACTYPNCDPPLRAGVKIWTGSHGCTAGFMARSNLTTNLFAFTAGHCPDDAGGASVWNAKFPNGTVKIVGSARDWMHSPDGDMAILLLQDPTGWAPQNWVYVTDGYGTTTDEQYTITSTGKSTVGMRICISGAFYGSSNCGTVQELGVINGGVRNLGRASYCRKGGDSGAPIFSYHVGYGIHHGADTDVTCTGYYQSLQLAESKMNVTTLTASP
jgi:hypothetical protein